MLYESRIRSPARNSKKTKDKTSSQPPQEPVIRHYALNIMKSTEGKVRGRPPIRKQLKNSSSSTSSTKTPTSARSENENNKSILDYFSPPRATTETSLNAKDDKRSGSTPKRRKNPLESLQSNLSPKYIGFSTPTSTDKRKSKYRTIKLKGSDDSSSYFSSAHSLIGCVRRTTTHGGQLNSPKSSPVLTSRRGDLFESPIDKLLRKNGAIKSLPNSPNQLTSPEFIVNQRIKPLKSFEEVVNKKKNCVVRLEQINHDMVNLSNSYFGCENADLEADNIDSASHNEEIEPEFDASATEHDLIFIQNEKKSLQTNTVVDDEEKHSKDKGITKELEPMDAVESLPDTDERTSKSEDVIVNTEQTDSKTRDEDVVMKDESKETSQPITKTPLGQDIINALSEVLTSAEIEENVDILVDEKQTESIEERLSSNQNEQISNEMKQVSEILKEETSIEDKLISPTNPVEVENNHQPNIPNESDEQSKLPQQVPTNQNNINETININTQLDGNQNSHQLLNSNSKFTSEEMLSLKSPSTYSVDSAKGSSLDNDLNWVSIETGDLFWGQIYKFAYWPCMVCPDPEGKTITMNEGGGSEQSQHVLIHVRFFADNGRRSWVKRDNLMTYNGHDNFQKKQKEIEQKYDKKSQKYKMFFVTQSKLKLWNQAIREADLIESIPMEERLEMFFKLVDEVKLNNLERKRRQSVNHSSTSDLYSMFDSNDNLYLKQASHKRERSPTPVSPAFSPVASKNSEKRLKLDHNDTSRSSFMDDLDMNHDEHPNETSTTTTIGTELERIQNEDIYNDTEFKKFASAMRLFVLENSKDPKLNHEFMVNVRSMWALKHITFRQRLEGQSHSNGMKRLSQRIRNISIQRSLPSTPVQQRIEETAQKSTGPKPKKPLNRPIDEVIDDIFRLDSKYLFRDIGNKLLCKECLKEGTNLVKCSMNCQTYLHPTCAVDCPEDTVATPFVHITGDDEEPPTSIKEHQPPVICKSCYFGEASKCFVCKKDTPELGDMARCNSNQCCKFYHPTCLKYWPQSKLTKSAGKLESLRCPAHVCHTCVSDDPKGKFLQIEKSKLTKCIKCPATYHMDSTCIPAGSQFLSASQIICPRHYKQQQDQLLNVNWCFICVAGGKLICCETCPTAVHAECLKIPVADEGYICEECETGRMPLYGEMVWAKFRQFRWWPSLILPPTEVPLNLVNKAHNPSEFVIRFFGSNDHAWISRRRVYLYQEGDCCEPPKNSQKGLDSSYTRGVEEAKRIAEIIKEKKMLLKANDKKQRVSPLPYVKIKSNRAVPPLKLLVDYEKISKCECDKDSPNPCGQESGCLNRVLYNECNPKICPAGERCENQMFEKKLYPKLEVMYMNQKGFGLICLEPISAGTFVIEYVGEVIDDAEFRRRISQKEQERDENFYFLTLEKDYIIDAGPKGNLARFMNHSCEPNCETQKWSVNGLDRIGLFAIKDIPKNTELTFNYYWDELLGNEKKMCHCGATKCAGVIGGKYKEPTKLSSITFQTEKIKSKRTTSAKSKSSQKQNKQKAKAKETSTKKQHKKQSGKQKHNKSSTPNVDISMKDDNENDKSVEQLSPSSGSTIPAQATQQFSESPTNEDNSVHMT